MYMIDWKLNCSGLKIPCLAMSIIPLLMMAPKNTPIAAMIIIVRNLAAFDPIAELRKFTASLLTPTHRSDTASTKRKITNPK